MYSNITFKKDYIKPNYLLQSEDYLCKICFDIPSQPVRCSGSCKQLYCRKCSSNWKIKKNRCPLSCSAPWNFSLQISKQIQFSCPYSTKCIIKSAEDFGTHLERCKQLPPGLHIKYNQKNNYLCEKNHLLEFFIGNYHQMVQSICSQCGEKQVCRSKCSKCKFKYCIKCRTPPCTKQQCPIGHPYSFSPNPSENYICDICGLASSFVNLGVYDDSQCNFGICELCYKKLPQSVCQNIKQSLKVKNNNVCQLNHNLQKLQFPQEMKCINCQQQKMCHKKCSICNVYYCFNCKIIKFKYLRCQLNHNYVSKQTDQKCNMCNINYFNYQYDQQCKYLLCYKCFNYLISVESDKHRFKIILQCQQGHRLKYIITNYINKKDCYGCKQSKIIQLYCDICNPKRGYCIQCKNADFKESCYFGHPLQKIQGNHCCYKCSTQKSNIWKCQCCKFYICQQCKNTTQ